MGNVLAILYALAFSLLGRNASDCQTGAIYFWEDSSYVIESSDHSIVCSIQGTPERDLSFVAVSYNDESGLITATRFSYVVGSDVTITLIETRETR